jgi:6,7-dimethyl-8-ribityllumazine synthase
MAKVMEGKLNAKGFRFGIVVSRFNDFINEHLLSGALDFLTRNGAEDGDIEICKVPGSFEIPQAARKMVLLNKYDAIICLGTVIRGSP